MPSASERKRSYHGIIFKRSGRAHEPHFLPASFTGQRVSLVAYPTPAESHITKIILSM
ncbi:hypothetical protein CDEST_10028 [Colletotrichum destructivum]|uniref:Uncharacterized protein n=1 Tax=Colletotrichum destructivum TaxID=34406 RepID=A0AAX4IQ47_9PEZI|nr:hypothetical protein CDEST_10028 [Colletotrichum destructivum]